MSSLKQKLKKSQGTPTTPKARNHVAASAIMKKGGVHTADTAKAIHRKARRNIRNELKRGDWS